MRAIITVLVIVIAVLSACLIDIRCNAKIDIEQAEITPAKVDTIEILKEYGFFIPNENKDTLKQIDDWKAYPHRKPSKHIIKYLPVNNGDTLLAVEQWDKFIKFMDSAKVYDVDSTAVDRTFLKHWFYHTEDGYIIEVRDSSIILGILDAER